MGVALVVALLALGSAIGVTAASLRAQPVASGGTALPAAASSPSVPVDPPPSLLPDPEVAAMPVDLELERQELGALDFTESVVAPRGWLRTDIFSSEATWRIEDNPANTFVLRQEQVTQLHRMPSSLVESRINELESAVDDFTVITRDDDTLEFTYVSAGYLRHGLITWVDLGGSESADLEVALTGRERDIPGMTVLLERVAAGARD